MKIFITILSVIFLLSCSTIKQEKQNSEPIIRKNPNNNLIIKGLVYSSLPETMNQSLEFKMSISGTDSIQLIIYGPLGMVLSKIYSTPDYFIALNAFQGQAIEGSPDADNLKRGLLIPISYNDMVHFFRSETANNPETFIRDISYTNDDKTLFKSKGNDFTDFALLNNSDANMIQYQRKTNDAKSVLDVLFSEFKIINGYSFANKIIYQLANLNGSVTFSFDNIEIIEKFDTPFNFDLPKGIKKYKL